MKNAEEIQAVRVTLYVPDLLSLVWLAFEVSGFLCCDVALQLSQW